MNAALVDELFAPDYVNHMMPGGREGFKQFFAMMRSAYPDLKMDYKIERLMAEGDYVMLRASVRFKRRQRSNGIGAGRISASRTVKLWKIGP